MAITSVLVGFGLGALCAAAAAVVLLRRHLRRVRAAERRARAAERMAEIGAMTGGLAHEIKNPLSTIGLNAQLLVEGIEELEVQDGDKSRLLNRTRALQRETERLRGILADFLEFAGNIHLDRREADLNEVVAELADFFLPEAERHGVRMRVQSAPDAVRAVVDVRLIKQALLNLMINATQAMGGAGDAVATGGRELLLRTELVKDGDGQAAAAVHVIDTGPGIDHETLSQIFKPYFTTKSGGSGLGLPTARRLIEEHGGRIVVKSEVGKGSDFAVIVPVAAVEKESGRM